MAPVLGYWNIRGFGQSIRLLLAYTETEYEEKTYVFGPPPEFDGSDWYDVKYNLGLPFPNLPYYIDGDLKMTQSMAIMRYLARKYDLEPDNEDGRIRVDIVEHQACDFRLEFAQTCYNPDFEKIKGDYLQRLPTHIKAFSDFLGKRKWFAGDKLTYVDFVVYETLDHHRIFAPDCLDGYQNLKAFLDRFEKLPTIQKYMKSEGFMKWPLHGDRAFFASRRTKP